MTAAVAPDAVAVDRAHLALAVAAASGAVGRTAPNPAVGCVLAHGDRVVGVGATAPAGGPHAEVVALTAAGGDAAGATAYVTLEPCDHHGRTPPCSEALVAAGVARVVIVHRDPHPRAAGGAARLRRAGVVVEDADRIVDDADRIVDDADRAVDDAGPTWHDAVAGQLEGFLTVVGRGRPHVTLKLAQTAAGSLHATGGRWVTGPAARRAVHRLRAGVDAVLVGSGTVAADDPGLDVRDVTSGDRPQPRPIVLDGRLTTPPDARVVARGALVVTAADPGDDVAQAAERTVRRAALVAAGAEVVAVPRGSDGHLDVAAALAAVAAAGVTTVLAEPGARLAAALLAADVVDRLVLHVADARGPRDVVEAVAAPAGAWRTTRTSTAGPDLLWERVRARTDDHDREER